MTCQRLEVRVRQNIPTVLYANLPLSIYMSHMFLYILFQICMFILIDIYICSLFLP